MSFRLSPPIRVVLYVAFLLVWGGVVGERHRVWVEDTEWWRNKGEGLVSVYFEAFARVRRNERTLPIEAVEAKALAMIGKDYTLGSRELAYLNDWDLGRIKKYVEFGSWKDDPERVRLTLLFLRFFRGDYEGILALGEDPLAYADSWGEPLRIAAEANRALFLGSGDKEYAKTAVSHYEDLIGSYPPAQHLAAAAREAGPLSEALRDLGKIADAEARLRSVIEAAATEPKGGYYASLAHAALARLMTDEGRLEEAAAETREAFLAACGYGQEALYERSGVLPEYCIDCWRKLGRTDEEIRRMMASLAGEETKDLQKFLDYWLPETAAKDSAAEP